jgi:hypothetical protein
VEAFNRKLIAARVLLGFGTCAGYPAAMYLIRSEAARTGENSPAFVLTALACLVMGWRRVPGATTPHTGRVELDLPGIALFAAMLTALLLFVMELHPLLLLGAGSAIWLCVAITVVLGVPQGFHELAIFLLASAGLFLVLTLVDRSLRTVTHQSV